MRVVVGAHVDVAAPAHRVWHAATDWRQQSRWMPLTRVRPLDGVGQAAEGSGGGVGRRLSGRTGIGPLGFDDPMTITRWDPPTRCEVLHTGRLVRGEAVFEVQPLGPGCRFTWWEHLEVPGGRVGGLAARMAKPVVDAAFARVVRRLRDLVEAEG